MSKLNTPLEIRLFSVLSGSMEPNIKIGSLVVVGPQDNYQKDSIITYYSEKNFTQTVTHRIIEISKDEDIGKISYQTKGDANEDSDSEKVPLSRVIGQVLFSIPFLGRILNFAQTQLGFLLLIVIPGTLLVYTEIQNIKSEIVKLIKTKRKKNEKK